MGQLKLGQGWSYSAALGATAIVTFPVVIAASDLFERLVDRPAIRMAGAFARYVLEPGAREPGAIRAAPAIPATLALLKDHEP